MQKLKMQLEAQIQEIVFFLSILLSFSVFLSGLFSMAMTPESLVYILGSFGSSINQALFNGFGYSYFYFSIIALHMGYVTNMHVFSFKDIKREYQMLLITAVAHLIILVTLASLMSVLQISLALNSSEALAGGMGGLIGSTFGQILYSNLGIYNSVVVLLGSGFATSIVAGFYEINDVLRFFEDISQTTKDTAHKSVHAVKEGMTQMAAFIVRDHRMATANVGFTASKSWMSQSINKANTYINDRLHLGTSLLNKKTERKAKPAVKKAVATKKAAAKPAKTETKLTATAAKAKKKSTSKKS